MWYCNPPYQLPLVPGNQRNGFFRLPHLLLIYCCNVADMCRKGGVRAAEQMQK